MGRKRLSVVCIARIAADAGGVILLWGLEYGCMSGERLLSERKRREREGCWREYRRKVRKRNLQHPRPHSGCSGLRC